jgi:hypothetical protein
MFITGAVLKSRSTRGKGNLFGHYTFRVFAGLRFCRRSLTADRFVAGLM